MTDASEHTVFSLSADMPEPSDVADGKAVSHILARGAVGELCSVRKLTRRGAVLHLQTPVEVGQALGFELMNGRAINGVVSWTSGPEVILGFAADLDIVGVIASELVSQPGERRRMPRIELVTPVDLRVGPRLIHAATCDVSQGGVKIAVRERLDVGARLDVGLVDLPHLQSEVRWSEDGFAGLIFDSELAWQDMMPWLRGVMRHLSGTAPASHPRPEVPAPETQLGVDLNIPARIREGAARWNVSVVAISCEGVTFESFARPRFGTLIAVSLPGLEGWPGRVTSVEGDRWTCEFAKPLHPAVVERVRARG